MSTETYHLLTLIGVIIVIVLQLAHMFGGVRHR